MKTLGTFVSRQELLKKLSLLKYDVKRRLALIILDVDDFRIINYSYGFAAGDRVLESIANRLKRVFSLYCSNFLISHLYANAFCVVVFDIGDVFPTRIREIYSKYLEKIHIITRNEFLYLTTSVGVSLRVSGEDPLEKLKEAEEALFEAKRKGKAQLIVSDFSKFSESMHQLRRKIVKAIEEETVEPYFQPIVSLRTGSLYGFEVLARIFYDGELIPNDRAIEIAIAFNLIPDIDRIIFSKASKYLGKGFKLFFNLSMKHFYKELNEIWKFVRKEDIKTADMVIEITESAKIFEMGVAQSIFQIFKDLDAKIAIDDFGAGYTSFSYLKKFPADILKIDGEFVKGAKKDRKDLEIVKSIVDVARVFRLRVLAEFIEDAEDYLLMKNLGIALGQGFFIGKPQPEPYSVRIEF